MLADTLINRLGLDHCLVLLVAILLSHLSPYHLGPIARQCLYPSTAAQIYPPVPMILYIGLSERDITYNLFYSIIMNPESPSPLL